MKTEKEKMIRRELVNLMEEDEEKILDIIKEKVDKATPEELEEALKIINNKLNEENKR